MLKFGYVIDFSPCFDSFVLILVHLNSHLGSSLWV